MQNTTLARYQQAHQLLQGIMTRRVILNDGIFPHWIGDSPCCWYQRDTRAGIEFRLLNAEAASNTLAFDHQALATALQSAAGEAVNAGRHTSHVSE